jgi:hypothetical protein
MLNSQYVPDSAETSEDTANSRGSFSPESSPVKSRTFFTPEGSPVKNKGYFTPDGSPVKEKGFFTPEGSPVKNLNPYYPDSYLASAYVPGSMTKDIASRNEETIKNNVPENRSNSIRSLSVGSLLSEGYEVRIFWHLCFTP